MKSSLSPQQAFLIYSMLFAEKPEEREPKLSSSGLAPKPRGQLVTMGLLRSEKRRVGRSNATYLLATEKAWQWAAGNLGTELKKTPSAARVLSAVLRRLRAVVGEDGQALARFAAGADAVPANGSLSTEALAVAPATAEVAAATVGIEERIRSVYLSLTGGSLKQRVLLKDLRPRIEASRQELDQALMRMQGQRKLVMMRLDNPSEVTEGDEEAALHIAGNPRHLVYLQD